eukprot:6192817-Pleurochrysis_carterae.AAC.1
MRQGAISVIAGLGFSDFGTLHMLAKLEQHRFAALAEIRWRLARGPPGSQSSLASAHALPLFTLKRANQSNEKLANASTYGRKSGRQRDEDTRLHSREPRDDGQGQLALAVEHRLTCTESETAVSLRARDSPDRPGNPLLDPRATLVRVLQ